jgi:hypothetical protein
VLYCWASSRNFANISGQKENIHEKNTFPLFIVCCSVNFSSHTGPEEKKGILFFLGLQYRVVHQQHGKNKPAFAWQ